MAEPSEDARRRAAARILAIARQFALRSRDSQIALVREFEDSVREYAAVLGRLSIEDDDDEQLALGTDGRFEGRMLIDDGAGRWQVIGGAADVIDHYDPVDLFADLSDALGELFPDLEAGLMTPPAGRDFPLTGNERAAEGIGSPGPMRAQSAEAETPPEPGLPGDEEESASRRMLRDLHDAGAYSDAEYAAKLAELDSQAG